VRPQVQEKLENGRRVCVVLGVAGWGKTTAVAAWARRHRTVWLAYERRHDAAWILRALERTVGERLPRPVRDVAAAADDVDRLGAAADGVCSWLRETLGSELVVVLDDLQRFPPGAEAVRLIEGMCWYAPPGVRIVLVSRREPPFATARLRSQGLLTEVDAADLALDTSEIAGLVRSALDGLADGPTVELAQRIQAETEGWPAAVQAAGAALERADGADGPAALERLVAPGERFHTYLAEEVVGREPDWVQALLVRAAVFDGITSSATLGAGTRDPDAVLADLTRRGLLRDRTGDNPRWSLVPPLARYFEHDGAVAAPARAELHAAAAGDCMTRGAFGDALRHLVAAGDREGTASVLRHHGPTLVSAGETETVLRAAELAPGHPDDARFQQIVGEARQLRGHWAAAFASYQRAAGDRDRLPPELAWRIMAMLDMQAEFGQVPRLFDRVALGREDTLDESWVLAYAASASRMVGDHGNARRLADRSAAAARRSGRPGAHGPAHNVLAMLAAAEGDRRGVDAHYTGGLEAAGAAHDTVREVWVRISRAVHLLELGSPREAAQEADALGRLGDQYGFPFLQAHARTIAGRAALRLGDPEAAGAQLSSGLELFQQIGSGFLAWPLAGLGDLHRTRGQLVRARAAYEEALRTAESGPDAIGASRALLGLARVRAADDLSVARSLAARGLALGEPLHRAEALLTRGWVTLLAGDRGSAATDAARAGAAARRRRDDLGLAEAILLSVQSSERPERDAALLDEAVEIWREAGCRLEEDLARLVKATLSGATHRLQADRAAEALRARGVDVESRRAAGPVAALMRSAPTVSVRALGVFQVVRNGEPVPKAAWQSKKARDLLKILVALRRPVPRDRLAELLWPGSDPGRSANRLSVLLSTLRDILQPGREEPAPLQSDGSAVWLDRARVRVDVEDFLEHADAALDAVRNGRPDAAEQLERAVATHGGDLLEDDPYEDWAAPLAEEVRARHTALLRALITVSRSSGDIDQVIRYGLRLLHKDPYDEEVRLDLVAALLEAGRLGEGRRHYDVYARRMREIDVEPRPMPRPPRAIERWQGRLAQ
jgi:DNA-binding SARP family transcriptional activator/tetratricopeptide (TPR) repeat protein